MACNFQGGAITASCGMGAPVFGASQHTTGPENRPVHCSSHSNPVARTCDGRAAMNFESFTSHPIRTYPWKHRRSVALFG